MFLSHRYSKTFRLICVYSGPRTGKHAISPLDGIPGYLHIHALGLSFLKKKESDHLQKNMPEQYRNILYQWGTPEHRLLGKQRPLIAEYQRRQYGNIGLGSIAKWDGKSSKSFLGGGEGFIYKNHVYRVTRGNHVFTVLPNDQYWMVQTTQFYNPFTTRKIRSINSRLDLTQRILSLLQSGDIPFICTFKAQFKKNTALFRSNGVFPEDPVTRKDWVSFYSDIALGGHVLGDSDNLGDLETPGHELASLELHVVGPVKIKPISDIRIAIEGDQHVFRPPRYQN